MIDQFTNKTIAQILSHADQAQETLVSRLMELPAEAAWEAQRALAAQCERSTASDATGTTWTLALIGLAKVTEEWQRRLDSGE